MKKTLSILLACIMLFALAGTAMADVIWTPVGDSFFDANRTECEYINRSYYSNDKSGYLEFFTQPGGESLGFAKNGDKFLIRYTYTDDNGDSWGIAEYSVGEDGYFVKADYANSDVLDAWVKMEGAALVYDSRQFIADNEPFPMLDADFSELVGKKILFWTYPGSGELVSSEDGFVIEDYFAADYLYTDEDGNEWVYVSYYYGMRDSWVCISDPMNAELPVHAVAAPDFYPTPSDEPDSTDDGGFDNLTLAVIIVCVVIAISIALIMTLGKKKKTEDETK